KNVVVYQKNVDADSKTIAPHSKSVAIEEEKATEFEKSDHFSGKMPDLTQLDAAGLVEKLADPSLEVRRLATNELVDRVEREGIDELKEAAQRLQVEWQEQREVDSRRACLLSAIVRLRLN